MKIRRMGRQQEGKRPSAGGRSRQGRFALIFVPIWVLSLGCSGTAEDGYAGGDLSGSQTVSVVVPDLSDAALQGADLFVAHCSECHGANAGGSSQGPPLVHKIYEPGHHADFSFLRAVDVGSAQHHWQYGDMAPVPGLSPEQVSKIVCYVRELQYANDIFTDPAGLAACEAADRSYLPDRAKGGP